ncbi:hypothetical protein Ahy_B03g065504 [Arachis hypogaea]|uniref:OTU domain-containing protein n=1 Tax=Arachis hypogaea TaxID=3818 RepID=A0A445A1Z6_ARAHY|nr:hypothetical protein Ahy_B03g065504 [Arachis hypogaea]
MLVVRGCLPDERCGNGYRREPRCGGQSASGDEIYTTEARALSSLSLLLNAHCCRTEAPSLSRLRSLAVSDVALKLVVVLSDRVFPTVSGLALSRARSPVLPLLSPVAEASWRSWGSSSPSVTLAVSFLPAVSFLRATRSWSRFGYNSSWYVAFSLHNFGFNLSISALRKEISQLQKKEIEMKKAEARGSKAEQKAKKKQLEDEVTRLSANLKEEHAKALADGSRESKQSRPDGHCLYRAVEDQLALLSGGGSPHRNLKTKEVESTALWGGQLEVGALTPWLKKNIMIFSGSFPDVEMGKEYKSADGTASSSLSVMLSYHKYAFGLGEHYNSMVPA